MTFRVVGQKEESVIFVKKKGIFLSIVQRRNGCFNYGELGHKKYKCTKEEGGAYVDPVLEGNGMAVTYVRDIQVFPSYKNL